MTVCSSTGTVHIFEVGHLSGQTEKNNTNVKSTFSFFGGIASIASSEWSFANFKLDASVAADRGMRAMVHNGLLHVLTKKGNYITVELTQKGGDLVNHDEQRLL